MGKCQLIAITGTVGGGKSSTSIAVAALLRAEGISTAVIDLDDIYLMIHPDFSAEGWDKTRRGAGVLANQFFADGYEIVIVEGGDFRTEEEFTELEQCVTRVINILRVTLFPTHEEVRRNVIADPNRDYTPPLKPGAHYKRFTQALPYLKKHTIVVETAGFTLTDVAGQVFRHAKASQP